MKASEILILAVLGYVAWSAIAPSTPVPPGPPPIVVPVGPAQPLVGRVTDKADAARLSKFYRELAAVVRRDTAIVGTTDQFATAHTRSLLLAFGGTDLAGKYNLAPTINGIVLAAMGGKPSAPLDASNRPKLAEVCEQIASAIGG